MSEIFVGIDLGGTNTKIGCFDSNLKLIRKISVSSDVEMDALWEFFFETGFIYPKKYHHLQTARDNFKETYQRLYQKDQDIEAHLTCEKNGQIYGHVSIVRAYQRAWMIHHLAARPLNGRRMGLFVLKNLHQFCDGVLRYPSSRMDHLLVYFRPDIRSVPEHDHIGYGCRVV